MWYIVDLNKTITDPISFTDKNGITHPSSIFTLWTPKELQRIGVTKVYGEDEKINQLQNIKRDVRMMASGLIEQLFPSHKQNNFLMQSTTAIIEFGTDVSEWPTELFQQYERDLIKYSQVNRIRKISNLVEEKITSLPFEEAILLDISKIWEEIDGSTS